MTTLCMVGTGYVGLVSGACFAETGQNVVCADISKDKIDRLLAGEIPIFEPGLDKIVARNVKEGRLQFSNDVNKAIQEASIVFVGVGTPSRSDGGADLSAVDAVAESVKKNAKRELVLVLKSTVPVGTNERVRKIVADAAFPIHVVSNPEFLKEGDAVNDFMKPDRVIVGCDDDDTLAKETMARLYHPVCLSKERIIWMRPQSAEITKYVSNTMLAMRISFMNELSNLCEKVGANIHDVRLGVGSDTRIGDKFLYAGPGYGGSCFPKDVKALVHIAQDHGMEIELAAATDKANDKQKKVLARKIKEHFKGDLRGKTVGVWGLAFKPKTDDIRESPALSLIDTLLAEGVKIKAHDPQAMDMVRDVYGDKIALQPDAYSAAEDVDVLVLVTEWRQYQNPDFEKLKSLMNAPVIIDGRNIWTTYKLEKQGFKYQGIGV